MSYKLSEFSPVDCDSMPASKKQPLEKSLTRLEEIVEKMESGEVPLEKSIEMYEEGMKLGKDCLEKLDALEQRVQLVREKENGEPDTTSFDQ